MSRTHTRYYILQSLAKERERIARVIEGMLSKTDESFKIITQRITEIGFDGKSRSRKTFVARHVYMAL